MAIGPSGSRLLSYGKVEARAREIVRPDEAGLSFRTIREHLAARRYPSAERAIFFARVLRSFRLPAYSAPRQLFMAGLLPDFIGVVARYYFGQANQQEDDIQLLVPFLKRLQSIRSATLLLPIFNRPCVARVAVKGRHCAKKAIVHAQQEVAEAQLTHSDGFPTFALAFQIYLYARDEWAIDAAEESGFELAWKRWKTLGTPVDPNHQLFSYFETALALAGNRAHRYDQRVSDVLKFLISNAQHYLSKQEQAGLKGHADSFTTFPRFYFESASDIRINKHMHLLGVGISEELCSDWLRSGQQ